MMKILHTADLHLGQVMYQYYERMDEYDHVFEQLRFWCLEYRPDALLVSGDLFDIQQPSASTKAYFNYTFATLHRLLPEMAIVAIAGNHDSASRIEADRSVWALSGVTLIGNEPAIISLSNGFIIAVPFMAVHRKELFQNLLDKVAEQNDSELPVVLMGHLALAGSDCTGHDEIGSLKTQPLETLGTGYDYAALGHIHRPQTLSHSLDDENACSSQYSTPVQRYSGSPLHVSCDEQYPHSVSLVSLTGHNAPVIIQRLTTDELRYFYTLPESSHPAASSAEEIYSLLNEFCQKQKRGYVRLRVDSHAALPTDFQQNVYHLLEATNNEVRYNPNIIWENTSQDNEFKTRPIFEVPELQQMSDPLDFIRKTIERYPELDITELEADFIEIEQALHSEL